CAMQSPAALARAGFGGSPPEAALKLFNAIVENPSGIVFSVEEWSAVLGRIGTPGGKIQLALPDLLEELDRQARTPAAPGDAEFPFVLSAGERRSFTANTIIRDPSWRKKDPDGALRMSPDDASALGVGTGDAVRLSTRRGSVTVLVEVSDTMQAGHVSLPNGLGLTYPDGGAGVAPNELTAAEDRDPFVGTPFHKHVPARIEAIATR